MTGYVRDAGSWKEMDEVHVRHDGAFVEASVAYIKHNGAWKVWHIKEYSANAILDIALNRNWPEA